MMDSLFLRPRPTPQALHELFKAQTGVDFDPSESKEYKNSTKSPVSAVTEYAPAGGVIIAYPGSIAPSRQRAQLPATKDRDFGIPDELIVRMQQADTTAPVHIFIFCNDAHQLPIIQERLGAYADAHTLKYDAKLVHLVPWDTDTYWTRDYAPWWLKNKETGQFGVAKHIYTTLGGGSVGVVGGLEDEPGSFGLFRPNDDGAAVKFSDWLNAPILARNAARWDDNKKLEPPIVPHTWYCTGLLQAGGNYMVTNRDVIASSFLVATQNQLPVNKDDEGDKIIDDRMTYVLEQFNRFMGLQTYYALKDGTGTYIGHIDCWAKFLTDDTVLIASSHHQKIDDALNQIAAKFGEWGFKTPRVMSEDIYLPQVDPPNNATTTGYTNSLILNNYVYVPITASPPKESDTKALAVYQEALPNYHIVGIPPKPDTPWLGTDAIHCRTHEVPREVVDSWLKSQEPM